MDILKLDKLKDALSGYLKVKIELLKLDITEHISKVLSKVIAFLIIFLIALFVIGFAGMALANYLNDLWGNSFGGYLVLSGIFLIILLTVLYLLKSGKFKDALESAIVGEEGEENE